MAKNQNAQGQPQTDTPPRRRVRKSLAERKHEILTTTLAQIRQRGLSSVRTSDVAKALDVSEGLIHYHFVSRERLVAEAYDLFTQMSYENLQQVIESVEDPLEKLSRLMSVYLPDPEQDEWALWIQAWAAALHESHMVATLRHQDFIWRQTVEETIAEGVSAGVFTTADPAASAWRITAMIDGIGAQVTSGFNSRPPQSLLTWIEEGINQELNPGQRFCLPHNPYSH